MVRFSVCSDVLPNKCCLPRRSQHDRQIVSHGVCVRVAWRCRDMDCRRRKGETRGEGGGMSKMTEVEETEKLLGFICLTFFFSDVRADTLS